MKWKRRWPAWADRAPLTAASLLHLFGPVTFQLPLDLLQEIGESFDFRVTRANYPEIILQLAAAFERASKEIPVQDIRDARRQLAQIMWEEEDGPEPPEIIKDKHDREQHRTWATWQIEITKAKREGKDDEEARAAADMVVFGTCARKP